MGNEKEAPQLFESCLFPRIFQTFRIAIQPSKLIIALLAVAIICSAGRIMDLIVGVAYSSQAESGIFSGLWYAAAKHLHCALVSLFALDFQGVSANITQYAEIVGGTFKDHPIYCIIFVVVKLGVICIAGGAICRIAALQFARGEKPGLIEALRFSTRKFVSFFTAPLAPMGIIAFMGLFVVVLGLIGNIPTVGELLIGIFMLLALIAGALISVVLIGAVAGFNLMFPAVAYDNSDCFDAISRSFSYVYARPWRMLFYSALAAVYGAVCYMFVRLFAFLLLWVTHRSLQFGILGDNKKLAAIWPKPAFADLLSSSGSAQGNWAELVAAFLVYLCVLAVVGLVVSFIISYYFSANTIIYSLMRNKVDNTALDDVYTYSEEAKAESATPVSEPEETEPQSESETQPQSEPETQADSSSSEQ